MRLWTPNVLMHQHGHEATWVDLEVPWLLRVPPAPPRAASAATGARTCTGRTEGRMQERQHTADGAYFSNDSRCELNASCFSLAQISTRHAALTGTYGPARQGHNNNTAV